MIKLQHTDEYGVTYAIDTYLTIADAQDALYQMECSLEDCLTSTHSYRLQSAIDQIKDAISEYEQ